MRPWPIILVLLSSLQAAACTHRHGSGAPRAASTLDSLVGIVSIAGTSFEQHIVLRSRNSTTTLEFSKSDSAALSRVGGTEVVVYGNSSADMFRVVNFEVVRVEGAPVLDGVLAQLGEKLVLETAAGRVLLGNPPTAFRGMLGARIWVGGPLDTGPNIYGIIVPTP